MPTGRDARLGSELSRRRGDLRDLRRPAFASTTSSANGREARLYQTAPISTNLILAYLGQHVLGMPRSY
jgi:hypothetical protein